MVVGEIMAPKDSHALETRRCAWQQGLGDVLLKLLGTRRGSWVIHVGPSDRMNP